MAENNNEWKTKVKIDPLEVKFQIMTEDISKSLKYNQQGSSDQKYGIAKLQIINYSKCTILFKVKTTKVDNYIVRPNSEVIPSEHAVSVKIVTKNVISN